MILPPCEFVGVVVEHRVVATALAINRGVVGDEMGVVRVANLGYLVPAVGAGARCLRCECVLA